MLRMALLGLLILVSVGVLSAMELRTPPRNAVAIAKPLAEPGVPDSAGVPDASRVLAKADRLDVVAVGDVVATQSESPPQAAPVEDRVVPRDDIRIEPAEPPKPIARQRHDPKKVATAARPQPKPKATIVKRTAAVQQRPKVVSDAEPCRLKAFGGLLKALNSAGCEL